MKSNKRTILKHSPYTKALTRNLKKAYRIHCRVDEESHAVYICTSYFLVKLNCQEYDALVRSVTRREAGNFVIYHDGGPISVNTVDLAGLLADSATQAVHKLIPTPFLLKPLAKGDTVKTTYYSESGDFVTVFNSDYDAMISDGLTRKSKNATSPMVIYRDGEPLAMIMSMRLDLKQTDVVRAYFTGTLGESEDEWRAMDERLARARKKFDN